MWVDMGRGRWDMSLSEMAVIYWDWITDGVDEEEKGRDGAF